VHNAGMVEMSDIRQHAGLAIIKGMIVGAGNHVDPEPLQLFE